MANPSTRRTANPPSLPPTVEEAYRRKCIQLKERYKEIEDENDAYRLRIARLKRQIQKSRLERAFLLEQIGKRTSTNVEDSEGSPSPPPTPDDKPLRTKRGHRKPSLLPVGESPNPAASFAGQNAALSPSSDAFSHSHLDSQKDTGARGANGVAKPPKRPSNAFEIYCNDNRPILQAKNKDKIAAGEYRLEEELARGWKDLPQNEKDEFQTRYEQELSQWREEREAFKRGLKGGLTRDRSRGRDSHDGVGRGRVARFEESVQTDEADDDQDVEMAEAEAEAEVEAEAEAEAEAEPERSMVDAEPDQDQYETEVEDNDVPVDD